MNLGLFLIIIRRTKFLIAGYGKTPCIYAVLLFFIGVPFYGLADPTAAQIESIRQEDEPRDAERNIIQLEQRQLLERARQQRESLRDQPVDIEAPEPHVQQPSQQQPCFTVSQINYQDATVFSPTAQQKLNKPYLAQCLTITLINQLVADVSNHYIAAGYITSRAFIPEQSLSSGILTIRVLEGRLEDIQLEHQPASMLKMAFPRLKGKILNLRDIEQGMEQVNRMRTQRVKIEILPGTLPGYSIVNLTQKPQFPLTFSLSTDNSGQKNTGISQLNSSIIADNLLGLADKWFVAGGHSSEFSKSHNARSLQTGVGIPLGYWNMDYSYTWSDYVNVVSTRGANVRTNGDSQVHRFNASRVMFRNHSMKTGLSFGVRYRESRNYIAEKFISMNSSKLSSGVIGINHSQKLWGGFATFNPGFTRGTRWFGADTDAQRHPDLHQAQFNKWTLSASYYLPLRQSVYYLTSLYGQHANQRLYGSEQLTLGGESSIRAFRDQYIMGNNGGYWRNEVTWQALTLPVLGTISLTAAVDGGWLAYDRLNDNAAGSLWGAAVSVASYNSHFTSQLTLGVPLSHPNRLKPDRAMFYYRVGIMM